MGEDWRADNREQKADRRKQETTGNIDAKDLDWPSGSRISLNVGMLSGGEPGMAVPQKENMEIGIGEAGERRRKRRRRGEEVARKSGEKKAAHPADEVLSARSGPYTEEECSRD